MHATQDELAADCLGPDGAAVRVDDALRLIRGRWKMRIVFNLFASPVLRFSELERAIEGISQKVLAQQLRHLEADGLVERTVHAEVPPRVDYRLTPAGEGLRVPLQALRDWSERAVVVRGPHR